MNDFFTNEEATIASRKYTGFGWYGFSIRRGLYRDIH